MNGSNEDPEGRLRASWDANARAWTDTVRGRRIASRRMGTDAAILDAVAALAPRRVLDVGCGEGWLARALSADGATVVGIDGSPALVERARALGGGTFEVASYEDLVRNPEVAGGSYDAVVCNYSLLGEHLIPLLGALRMRTAAEGRLLIQTVHPWSASGDEGYRDGWRREEWRGFEPRFDEPMPWYFRTLESWIACLRASGFVVEDLREPAHPETQGPLSLLLVAVPLQPGRGTGLPHPSAPL